MHSHSELCGCDGPAGIGPRRPVNAPTAATLVGMGLAANLAAATPALPVGLAVAAAVSLLWTGVAGAT
ncbi:MAG: hypothetical protein M1531_03825, partial [Chloroflexi bacterium]|nr:hypothetical protein [Chloroflexota bacterium]